VGGDTETIAGRSSVIRSPSRNDAGANYLVIGGERAHG